MNGRIEAIERAGHGPVVVLVHGFTGSPWELEPLVDALAGAGYAVRAPLLPGHGESPAALARTCWDATSSPERCAKQWCRSSSA